VAFAKNGHLSGTGTGTNNNFFAGGTSAPTNPFGQPSGSGGASTNIFGQQANSNPGAQSNLFASQQQQPHQHQHQHLFSSNAQAPFSSSQLNPNAGKPGMFGSTLGADASKTTRFGASFAPTQEPSLQQRIEDVYKAWDTSSADGGCKFQARQFEI
jgi:hypothetical protein